MPVRHDRTPKYAYDPKSGNGRSQLQLIIFGKNEFGASVTINGFYMKIFIKGFNLCLLLFIFYLYGILDFSSC